MENSKTIHIALCSDASYIKPLSVLLQSIRSTLVSGWHVQIHLIFNGNADKIDDCVQCLPSDDRISVRIIPFQREELEQLAKTRNSYVSISTFSRLFLGSLLPGDLEKVLYLDGDIIFEKSAHFLWECDLGDSTIAAVQDVGCPQFGTSALPRLLGPEIVEGRPYFNAGVLIIDLKKWRANKLVESQSLKWIEMFGNDIHDQDILNLIFGNDWNQLPPIHNMQTKMFFLRSSIGTPFKEEEFVEACQNPVVLHYSFSPKPWEYKYVGPCHLDFLHHARKAGWTIQSIRDRSRLSLARISVEMKNVHYKLSMLLTFLKFASLLKQKKKLLIYLEIFALVLRNPWVLVSFCFMRLLRLLESKLRLT